MKRFLLCISFSGLFSQSTYLGSISFDYTGSESGSFNAEISESSLGGATAGVIQFDSTSTIIISALEAIDSATVSLLLIYLVSGQEDLYPDTWSLPPDDLTDPNIVVGYFPEVDTSFFGQFLDLVPDSSNLDSTYFEDLIESLFTVITNEAYFGLTGNVIVNHIDSDSLVGSFDIGALQAGFPPGILNISNGAISMIGVTIPQVEIEEEIHIPSENRLYPAYPNPFNPITTIRFTSEASHTSLLRIYDINGRLVQALELGKLEHGFHEIQWNARAQPSGLYFIQLVNANQIWTEKVLLMK